MTDTEVMAPTTNPQLALVGKGYARHITTDGQTTLCGRDGIHDAKDVTGNAADLATCVPCKTRLGYRGNR